MKYVLKYVVLTFESMDEILWCYHSNETSSAVLSHGAIYLVCSSNFWVYGWNPMVLPFKWNLSGKIVKIVIVVSSIKRYLIISMNFLFGNYYCRWTGCTGCHSLDSYFSLKILVFNPPSPHCNFQWPSLGQEWILYYTLQGSKLLLIRSPVWLTFSPWSINILVGGHLGDQISLWFRFKVKE